MTIEMDYFPVSVFLIFVQHVCQRSKCLSVGNMRHVIVLLLLLVVPRRCPLSDSAERVPLALFPNFPVAYFISRALIRYMGRLLFPVRQPPGRL